MTLNAKLAVHVQANLSSTLDLGEATAPLAQAYKTVLTSGTGAGQADKVFHDQRTIAASGTENLDLAGVLTDPLGGTLTFAKVKGLIVAAAAANTNNVIVGGDATSTWLSWVGDESDSVVVRPGGVFALICGAGDATGYAVTAATGDLLKVSNSSSGTSVTYDVIIIGTSA